MFSHLKQYKELLLLLPPCALASAFRRFEANSPPKPATKNLCGCPSLPISHKCGRIWMNPGETRGDACVTDAPSLPCSAVHRASWKLPDRERRERERDQVPHVLHTRSHVRSCSYSSVRCSHWDPVRVPYAPLFTMCAFELTWLNSGRVRIYVRDWFWGPIW